MAKIIFHLSEAHAEHDLSEKYLALYGVIQGIADASGITTERRVKDRDIKAGVRDTGDNRFNDGNLHIIDQMVVSMPNVLNGAMAYLDGFWHLDPNGCKYFSSIGDLPYDEASVPYRKAKPFFQKLNRVFKEPRRSRYQQPREWASLPKGAIAVFFQNNYPLAAGVSDFGDIAMLKDVLEGAGNKNVIVKPHPNAARLSDIADLCEIASRDQRVVFTESNVHDILAACCVSVSVNSAASIEGFMHRKPAILYGKADFHHLCETISGPGQFAAALERSLDKTGGYAQYLTWYFRRNCLRIGSPDLEEKIWQTFSAAGFPRERFLN